MFSSAIKGTKGTGAPNPPATNPPFKYVEALFHFNGTNLDNASTGFTDTSPSANTVNLTSPLQGFPVTTNNPFNASYSIDCRIADNPNLTFSTTASISPGTGAFCIEFWMFGYSYYSAGNHRCPYSLQNNDLGGRLSVWFGYPGSETKMLVVTNGGTVLYTSTMDIPLNTWCHIAIVRNASASMNIYLNGVGGTAATVSTNFTVSAGSAAYIGTNNTNNLPFDGLLSNLRQVNGNPVYTGNFTPPTSPLTVTQSAGTNINAITSGQCVLLTLQRPYHNDVSASQTITRPGLYPWYVPESPFPNATLTTPSTGVAWSNASFGGSVGPCSVHAASASGSTTGTYEAYVNTTANFGFGTSNWTIDMWVYLMTDAVRCDFINIYTSNTTQRFGLYTDLGFTGELVGYLNGSGPFGTTGVSATSMVGQWLFLAVSRSGNSLKLFVNGVQKGSTYTTAFTLGASNLLLLGNDQNIIGMQACTRVINGAALYTANFAIPTTPSTSTGAQTKFLLTSPPGVIDQAMKQTLVGANGTYPSINTARAKFGSTSAFFDAFTTTSYWTSFYYNSNANSNIYFGTSDFTVEAWVYPIATSSDRGIFQIAFTPGGFGGQTGLALGIYTSNNIRLFYGAASAATGTAGTIAQDAWSHVAVVRQVTWAGTTPTGTLKVYINGIIDNALTVTDSYSYPTAYLTIGGYNTTSKIWNGSIDEFRISKYAVYTSNFTPPTSAFPDS